MTRSSRSRRPNHTPRPEAARPDTANTTGLHPDDPSLARYFALAEELDVPAAIHMAGGGLPDEPAFRARLGNPLLLEEVMVRRYPQVYADPSKISDANAYPREQFHGYLRSLMRANLGDRLMFGSDAAGPGALGRASTASRPPRFSMTVRSAPSCARTRRDSST